MTMIYDTCGPNAVLPHLPSSFQLANTFDNTTTIVPPGASQFVTSSGTVHVQVSVTPPPAQPAVKEKKARKKRKTKVSHDGPIHVLVAIDASGSMLPKANDVIGGFNGYVAGLRADRSAEYRLTAILFDTNVRTLYADLPIDEVPLLDHKSYAPGGGTALLDAVGVSLDELTSAVKKEEHPYGTDRVLVVIMTDGEENSSRRFTKESILTRIQVRQLAGNWTFVYLGEAADTWMASQLGIPMGNVVVYNSSTSSGSAFGALARSTTNYAASGVASNAAFGQTLDPAALGVNLNGSQAVNPGQVMLYVGNTTPAPLPANDWPPRTAAPAVAQQPPKKRTTRSSSRTRKPVPATAP